MKNIMAILVFLMLIPLATGMKDCKRVVAINDLPCMVKSSWQYPKPCSSYSVEIYNEARTLVRTATMGDYGTMLSHCNITFGLNTNETTAGSYFLNFTGFIKSGDTAIITVEGEDKMASLSVTLFIGAITLALFYIGIRHDFTKNQVANLIFKRCCILLGLFLLSLDTTIIVTMADNAGLGVNRELFRYLWMVNWTIYLFMVWLFWTTLTGSLRLWSILAKKKRMGLGGEDEHTSIVRNINTTWVTDLAYNTPAELYTAAPHTNLSTMQGLNDSFGNHSQWLAIYPNLDTDNTDDLINGTDARLGVLNVTSSTYSKNITITNSSGAESFIWYVENGNLLLKKI